MRIPREFFMGEVYLPPLFVASCLGVVLTIVLFRVLRPYRISRFLFYPPLAFAGGAIINTILIGQFFIPF
ncbi:MAG: DUF1656 domain-containing protein [Thermodesulfobacteriota bacterium]|nr:DUF1656 domain-containing protein [Thermodesulfobacteriota bacterium]